MATLLGVRSSAAPLPTGMTAQAIANGGGGGIAWPAVGGNLVQRFNAPQYSYEIGVVTTERCFWIVSGQTLHYQASGNYQRADLGVKLFNSARVAVNDLNGIGMWTSVGSTDQGLYWNFMLEGFFYLDPGTYYCSMVSNSSSPQCAYYTGVRNHGGLIGYTVGEGVY